MTEQRKIDEIAAIDQQLSMLREQAGKVASEAEVHIEKRDKLNEQFKKLRNEISELKNERDNLNEKVKILKQQRGRARDKIAQIIEETKVHSQKIQELKKKTPKKSRWQLEKELQEIEWKIQTTSLDLQEERRLIETVAELEKQLNIYRKIEQLKNKIAELRKELKTLKTNADAQHQELIITAQKSQELHASMIAKINESKSIKKEADSLHAAYIQAKERAKPLYKELRQLAAQKKKLQDTKRQEDESKKKKAEQALKEKLEFQARTKLQRGEKLSWHEFQLLADQDEQDPKAQD